MAEENELTEQQIIDKLSEMHNEGSTDPETLCGATIHQFSFDHPGIVEVPSLQPVLFMMCKERGDEWTKM